MQYNQALQFPTWYQRRFLHPPPQSPPTPTAAVSECPPASAPPPREAHPSLPSGPSPSLAAAPPLPPLRRLLALAQPPLSFAPRRRPSSAPPPAAVREVQPSLSGQPFSLTGGRPLPSLHFGGCWPPRRASAPPRRRPGRGRHRHGRRHGILLRRQLPRPSPQPRRIHARGAHAPPIGTVSPAIRALPPRGRTSSHRHRATATATSSATLRWPLSSPALSEPPPPSSTARRPPPLFHWRGPCAAALAAPGGALPDRRPSPLAGHI
jgi:hypothetical protein